MPPLSKKKELFAVFENTFIKVLYVRDVIYERPLFSAVASHWRKVLAWRLLVEKRA